MQSSEHTLAAKINRQLEIGVAHLSIAGCSSRALADNWFALWPVPVSVKLHRRLREQASDSDALLRIARAQIEASPSLCMAATARAALISLRIDLIKVTPVELRVDSYFRLRLDQRFAKRPSNNVTWRE